MKAFRFLLVATAFFGITAAHSQTTLQHYLPGFRTIDGTQLNLMVDVVNTLSGNGVSPLSTASITGSVTPFPITGLAATQGGSVVITGGTSSTAANAGGAVNLVGGTPGATGVGGAVNVTGGAAVAGVGGAVVVTAGASAGGTSAGAVVNLVPGAAISTGIPGTVQINGNSNLICATFFQQGAASANTDTVFFVATRPLLVVTASEVHAVAAGGASVVQLVKDTGTDAPGAGTDLLTNNTNTGFDLAATANTVQAGVLTSTVATKTLAAGNRLSVDFANAVQASSGITVTACMAPL